jgi:ActR/RegA family two-component response regulator
MRAPTPRKFALLVDGDPMTRSIIEPALLGDLQLVQSRTGNAALALLQRMAEHFGLALVTLDLEDMPGRVVIDTIRLFRPEIRVVCLSGAEGVTSMVRATAAAIEQAKVTFALSGDLGLAARELQRGATSERAGGL